MGWDHDILEAIGVPVDIFPEVVYPGEILGTMRSMSISVPDVYDTGSAVVAVPTGLIKTSSTSAAEHGASWGPRQRNPS